MTSSGRSLADALELIQSDRARERNEGLAEIKRIFKLYQSSPEINRITDNSFHSLLEGLFRVVTREKANYSRSTKSRQQETTESRLNVCADALRSTIEASLPRLRLKSLNALIGHFVQVLPNTDRTFFEPLSVSYLRTLSIVLRYPPHAEHLPQPSWNELVDLCLQGVESFVETVHHGPVNNRSSVPAGTLDSLSSRFSQAHTTRQRAASAKSSSTFQCLRCLVSTTTHHLLDRARQICDVTIAYLSATSSSADALDAFSVLHKCLSKLSLESVQDTQQYLLRLLPVITAKWRQKTPELRDEILKVFVALQDHLLIMVEGVGGESLQGRLDDLNEALIDDYVMSEIRPRRSHLTLEDLSLDLVSNALRQNHPLQARSIALQTSNIEAEHNWTVLWFIAMFSWCLDRLASRSNRGGDGSPVTPQKRRKLDNPLVGAVQKAARSSESLASRTRWIQILAFICNTCSLSHSNLELILSALLQLASNTSNLIASWALVALSGCATQDGATGPEFREQWRSVWSIAFRLTSTAQPCRAACHALSVMLRHNWGQPSDVLKSVETIISSGGLSHPATLCDSSITLWLELQGWLTIHQSGGAAAQCSQEMAAWIIAKWTPSNFENRGYAIQCSQTLPIRLLILPFLGFDKGCNTSPIEYLACLHPIAQAWLHRSHCRRLTGYLLVDSQGRSDPDKTRHGAVLGTTPQPSRSLLRPEARNAFIAKLASEVDKVVESWQNDSDSSGRKRLSESITLLFALCLVCECVCNHPSTRGVAVARLSNQSKLLQDIVFKQLYIDANTNALDNIAQMTIDILSNVFWAAKDTSSNVYRILSKQFMERIQDLLQRGIEDRDASTNRQEIDVADELDLDMRVVDSQIGQPTSVSSLDIRQNLEVTVSPSNFWIRTVSFIALTKACVESNEDHAELPTLFINYLLTLSPSHLVSARKLLEQVEMAEIFMKITDAERLLVLLGESCMENYLMRRGEVSICMVIQVLKMNIALWTDTRNESLAGIGLQMYDWLIKANEAGICSSEVQVILTDFLFKLIKFKNDYDARGTRPSMRTSVLRVLSQGDLVVQDHVARHLPNLFGMYVISQHDLIFDDIHNSLPKDPDWIEGIAMRVLILSKLASSWSTLLRKCIYHIFETAALVPEAVSHARCCIERISKDLGLESPKDVLALFRSQMMYTWLEEHEVESIPYAIFGFNSLSGLLEHSESEILSQLIMRGYSDKSTNMQHILSVSERVLLERNFTQLTAYCTAADVSTTSADGKAVHVSEERITEVIGKTRYVELLGNNFSEAVGTLFLRVENEDSVEKALLRRRGYEPAGKAVRQMKSAENEDALPLGQQPSFKAKYLIDSLERLCRRTANSPFKIWTPVLTTTVFRMLLNDAHQALGYFHTRRVIRRLRIVIGMAGNVALSGYPLELLLHSLRPYLSVNHCSQDATGVYRFLLEQGNQYLLKAPAFVIGNSLCAFLSMRELLRSSQDSTTQESQHLATLSKAKAFREWLSQWLGQYVPVDASESLTKTMSNLMGAAQMVTGPGSSAIDNVSESKLLQYLLDDMRQRKSVLTPRFAELCIKLLCREFIVADSFRDDIIQKGSQAAHVSSVIWQASQWQAIDPKFLLWSGKTLGQAFRYDGVPPHDLMPESSLGTLKAKAATKSEVLSSEVAITDYFLDTLLSERVQEVAIAETTVQRLLSASDSLQDSPGVATCIPEHIRQALRPETELALQSIPEPQGKHMSLEAAFASFPQFSAEGWLRRVNLALIGEVEAGGILQAIAPAIEHGIGTISSNLFPFILHLTLEALIATNSGREKHISQDIGAFFLNAHNAHSSHRRHVIDAVLYLFTQPYPGEKAKLDRHRWLDIDLEQAAQIATECKMFKTALFLVEIWQTLESQHSRRSSSRSRVLGPPNSLLLSVFKEIDEPDAFHGVVQDPELDAVAERLAFESVGSQELLIRGAQTDGRMRAGTGDPGRLFDNTIRSLARLNMSSLTYNLGISYSTADDGSASESITKAAMRLKQWDVPLPGSGESNIGSLYHTFRSIREAADMGAAKSHIDTAVASTVRTMLDPLYAPHSLRASLSTLTAFTDADEVLCSRSTQDFHETYARLEMRRGWTDATRLEDVDKILASRETLLSVVSDNNHLHKTLGINRRTAKLYEVRMNLRSAEILRSLGSFQQSLSNVAYLSEMTPMCEKDGLQIGCAVKQELSNVLWERGELVPSIQILRNLVQNEDFESQSIPVGKAGLLATLGKRISEARLEKPEEILNKYLATAQKALKRQAHGEEAGRVYHEFANYCHAQLSNPDSVREYNSVQSFAERRASEIEELDSILKTKLSEEQKQRAKIDRNRARKWFEIDRVELQRIGSARERFLRQSLENYILALAASDEHDTDVLRFVALWLEHAEDATANEAVANGLSAVPLHKFASLMNQLASRLQEGSNLFQETMFKLVEQICVEHPWHGMYHIYAGCNTKGGNDPSAISRNAAAKKIAYRLHSNSEVADIWANVKKANDMYINLASYKSDALKSQQPLPLKNFRPSRHVEREVPTLAVPPLTMSIPLRADRDYDRVPTVTSFRSTMSIASGLSAPKILTAIASDGSQHKQLFKSGSDDLRQDAIMEQVFEVVSSLLKNSRATRQRNLRIRTYKVIPLNATSGAIEFVQNTMALLEYIRPAHQRYYPRDIKWDAARQHIDEGRTRSSETRLRIYKDVADKFHPVLRHFFFERFEDPEDWFAKRLAYTRSTASISILGHAVGLGDRHCQNILLDTVTGEVVHIDLGVAFEAGRILAVPEVVPFRLTRDIVDGMGVMGVEGVFRRCCEFTLEALRRNRDAVMTLLNVLRYDPLYSWSLSPLRAKRLQDEQREREMSEQAQQQQQGEGKTTRRSIDVQALTKGRSKGEGSEERDGGEADRALGVVERKLAPSLSVMATVNELIQQATDERNLAVLFCGWAAFA